MMIIIKFRQSFLNDSDDVTVNPEIPGPGQKEFTGESAAKRLRSCHGITP